MCTDRLGSRLAQRGSAAIEDGAPKIEDGRTSLPIIWQIRRRLRAILAIAVLGHPVSRNGRKGRKGKEQRSSDQIRCRNLTAETAETRKRNTTQQAAENLVQMSDLSHLHCDERGEDKRLGISVSIASLRLHQIRRNLRTTLGIAVQQCRERESRAR